MSGVRVLTGDCRETIAELVEAGELVDAIVTDPPYHLTANKRGGSGVASVNLKSPYGRARIGTGNGPGGFMGQEWDGGDIAFDPDTWARCFDILKPGGYLVAFGGTRTYHRMACAIEDAGFEIRDQLAWVYGSGFPKSLNVAKAIDKLNGAKGEKTPTGDPVRHIRPGADQNKDGSWEKLTDRTYEPHEYSAGSPEAAAWQGWGTALKPAWEPIVLARKPLDGTVAQNVLQHGTGALNIDGCRVEHQTVSGGNLADNPHLREHINGGNGGHIISTEKDRRVVVPNTAGRWPANLVLSWPEDEYQLRSDITPDQKHELYRWLSENT